MSAIHSPAPAPILVTEPEAATYLGISSRVLYELRKSGKLPFVKFGPRGFRYRVIDLQNWAANLAADSVTTTKVGS